MFRSTAEILDPKRPPTNLEREAIAEVVALATDRAAPADVRRITTWRQRRLAVQFTPIDSPDHAPLMTLLAGLIADAGIVRTKHGDFTEEELREAEVKIERPDGRTLLVFPVVYPWSKKPDENGRGGIRANAIYRRAEDRGPRLDSFRVVPHQDVTEKEWWQE